MNAEPTWWRDRLPNTVSRAFAEMYAARRPDPRPLASVTQIGPVLAERRAERVVEAIRRMTKEA
jgi:hypothetical protein